MREVGILEVELEECAGELNLNETGYEETNQDVI